MKINLIILFTVFALSSFGQAVLEPKHTINVEVGLPVTMANKTYKWMMQGVVNTSLYYQYRFPSSFAIGAGANFSLATINIYKVKPSIKGQMYNIGGFVKIAHEKFYSETFGTDFGLKIGYQQTTFKDSLLGKDYSSESYSINSINMTPMVTFKLMADEANSYGFTIGYTFNDFNFYPARLGFTPQGFTSEDFQGSTQFMTVGFSYTHYIGLKTE